MSKSVKNTRIGYFGQGFVVAFLLMFMLFIFGPSEIFFTNVGDFDFVYSEFAVIMGVIAIAGSVVAGIIVMLLPNVLRKIVMSIIFGISVVGYIQVMFINEGLDLLGMNPEGYTPEPTQAAVNIAIWIAIIIVALVIAFWKEKIWQGAVVYLSVFLILIQVVALVSLMAQAGEGAYKHPGGDQWFLSSKDQSVVSAKDNILVVVLDYFSNQYMESAIEQYPDLLDGFNDFTYYNNTDCTYFGTYPSLAHMTSGNMVDTNMFINDWTASIWQAPLTKQFYDELHKKNYVVNIYTPDKDMLCGMNSVEILDGTFDNVTNAAADLIIDYKLLVNTMTKMSCYRFAPYALKPFFYVNVNAYTDIVQIRGNCIYHNNSSFNKILTEEGGLSTDVKHNYYVVQHLMGVHSYETTEEGTYTEESTREETIKGCMVIMEEYFRQLKELGVYDDATIIITSDHGGPRDSQVIFFMKEPGEHHDAMQVTSAPIAHTEYMPTIARAAGLDYTKYGQSVQDIPADVPRERTVWVRLYREEFPSVLKYSGEETGVSNSYCGFTYTGGINELFEAYDRGPDIVLQEQDCFF